MEGTFALEQANIQSDRAPDVVMAFRWDASKNQFDVPGMIDADWQRAAGKGTHATLSRFDMHNTLIAAGPDFKRGETNDLASGNVDLAPTILQILGIKPPKQLDGRILSEVMVNSGHGAASRNGGLQSAAPAPSRKPETQTIEATKHFHRERGGNRFKSRVSVRRFISTKATAPLRMNQQRTNYIAIAERIASSGASRLNQIENDSAP